jgi:hypothetical protein
VPANASVTEAGSDDGRALDSAAPIQFSVELNVSDQLPAKFRFRYLFFSAAAGRAEVAQNAVSRQNQLVTQLMQEQRQAERVVHPAKISFMAQPMPLALFLLNVIGAIAYLARASSGGWAIPQERAAGIQSITGEPFVWFVAIFPIVVFFFLLNFVWGAVIVRRQWQGVGFWLLAALVWLGAVAIDFAHH